MKSISCLELYNLASKNDCIIIDLRGKYEYRKGHVSNSINIPYEILVTNVSKYLNRNLTYYLICDSGRLSVRATMFLESHGYQAISVINGYDDWNFPLTG